mmetsp:Transcript_28688/g.66800  ORF Transcript_28688/g.66800 Transcript_28688/m.66800 type:complete len:290 (+) Transcript_28688:757-1626(+)
MLLCPLQFGDLCFWRTTQELHAAWDAALWALPSAIPERAGHLRHRPAWAADERAPALCLEDHATVLHEPLLLLRQMAPALVGSEADGRGRRALALVHLAKKRFTLPTDRREQPLTHSQCYGSAAAVVDRRLSPQDLFVEVLKGLRQRGFDEGGIFVAWWQSGQVPQQFGEHLFSAPFCCERPWCFCTGLTVEECKEQKRRAVLKETPSWEHDFGAGRDLPQVLDDDMPHQGLLAGPIPTAKADCVDCHAQQITLLLCGCSCSRLLLSFLIISVESGQRTLLLQLPERCA